MRRSRSRIVCACHDVTEADLEDAVASGHTDPETVKRATAAYMGTCQGKACAPLVQEMMARLGVEPPGRQRRPTVRLPISAVPLGALVDPDAEVQG